MKRDTIYLMNHVFIINNIVIIEGNFEMKRKLLIEIPLMFVRVIFNVIDRFYIDSKAKTHF